MEDETHSHQPVATGKTRRPNISTDNQPEGAARRPSDTLDREPTRDPVSGGTIPSDYNPDTMTRRGEENDTQAGREMHKGGK